MGNWAKRLRKFFVLERTALFKNKARTKTKNLLQSRCCPKPIFQSRAVYFSLLEIMVGLALILMAAGAIGWKMQGLIEKRRFSSGLEHLKSRVLTLQRMAVNMQADWEGRLVRGKKHWTFETVCLDDTGAASFSSIKLPISDVFFDGKKQNRLAFQFFSSGEVWPIGTLQFRGSKEATENWDLPAIFGRSQGDGSKKLGPVHPEEG